MAVTITKQEVQTVVARTKAGAKRADIATELGIQVERVAVVQNANHIRGEKSWERYGEGDVARVKRWLAAHAETVREVRKMAAMPGPKAPAKPRARRSSK